MHNEINTINTEELLFMHQYIFHYKFKKNKQKLEQSQKERAIPIEKILEMSSSSKSCWAENIVQERMDRE